jgi:hypothetical protein
LTHGKNIEFILEESFVHSVEMELWCHDLIIVEQEDELGFSRIDGRVASFANSDVMLFKINHAAVFGCFRILAREPMFGQTIVHDDDLRIAELLSKRLYESMAGPRPMNGLYAKSDRIES